MVLLLLCANPVRAEDTKVAMVRGVIESIVRAVSRAGKLGAPVVEYAQTEIHILYTDIVKAIDGLDTVASTVFHAVKDMLIRLVESFFGKDVVDFVINKMSPAILHRVVEFTLVEFKKMQEQGMGIPSMVRLFLGTEFAVNLFENTIDEVIYQAEQVEHIAIRFSTTMESLRFMVSKRNRKPRRYARRTPMSDLADLVDWVSSK